jgi:tRNA threonylcarbamoyladenosine biosynthesis protein TsaE
MLQMRLGRRQVQRCHRNLRKSQCLPERLNLCEQQFVIDRQRTPLINPTIVKTLVWPDEAATAAFATQLAAALTRAHLNACIALHGDLGAGKTTFVRHLLQALGVQGRVKSPTYAVVEPYTVSAGEVWHFDFYRFSDPREWEDAGFRDIFASAGLKLCEWPQNAAGVMPTPDLEINIDVDASEQRQITIHALTPSGQELLA